MTRPTEKQQLGKKNWTNSFNLVGKAVINDDYTYKIDKNSEKSDWVYNTLNLGVDCGKYGTIYSEMMGGYGSERDNVIYVHGKDAEGKDDFKEKFTIAWEDRFNDDVLEGIGDLCFLTVGIEKDTKGKTFTMKFLSEYDAIAYVQKHLENGMIINVKGTLSYSIYEGKTSVKKKITSIYLSGKEDVEDFKATFTQTMLLNKDSIGKADKKKGIIPIYATVLDYTKMWGDKEVKCFIPIAKTFEYECDLSEENKEKLAKTLGQLFKVKKNITETTFYGNFYEGGAAITATVEDLPDDIKTLLELGVYTEEEALKSCTEGTSKERRMVLTKPVIKMTGEEGSKKANVQRFDDRYTEEDLILDFMYLDDEEDETSEQSVVAAVTDNEIELSEEDVDFLATLGM